MLRQTPTALRHDQQTPEHSNRILQACLVQQHRLELGVLALAQRRGKLIHRRQPGVHIKAQLGDRLLDRWVGLQRNAREAALELVAAAKFIWSITYQQNTLGDKLLTSVFSNYSNHRRRATCSLMRAKRRLSVKATCVPSASSMCNLVKRGGQAPLSSAFTLRWAAGSGRLGWNESNLEQIDVGSST